MAVINNRKILTDAQNVELLKKGMCRIGEEVETKWGESAYIIGVVVWQGVPCYQTEVFGGW